MPFSPWIPIPTSISSSAMANVGRPASGTMQGVSATPIVRVLATAFSATAATSSRLRIWSAAAPAHL